MMTCLISLNALFCVEMFLDIKNGIEGMRVILRVLLNILL